MGKTLQVIADRAYDKDRSYRPGELVEGRFADLTNPPGIVALKLYELMFRAAGAALAEDRWHTLDLAAIKAEAGIKNLTKRELVDLFKELSGAVMEYQSGTKIVVGSLLAIAEIETDDGPVVARWKFGEAFRHIAQGSDYWAIIDRSTALSMTSRYAMRLHEMIALRANLSHKASETFTLLDLRARLGVPKGKLERWDMLNRKAIQPAINEVNRLSRFAVTAVPKKRGRTVVGVEIFWSVRTHAAEIEGEPVASQPSLFVVASEEASSEAPKAPRTRAARKPASDTAVSAKRRSKADAAPQPLAAFPSEGSLHYTAWAEPARRQLPQPTPDLGVVADAFRRWAKGRKMALDHRDILQIFETWCGKYQVRQ
jgi:predicted RecA/RadA family phage recombinase